MRRSWMAAVWVAAATLACMWQPYLTHELKWSGYATKTHTYQGIGTRPEPLYSSLYWRPGDGRRSVEVQLADGSWIDLTQVDRAAMERRDAWETWTRNDPPGPKNPNLLGLDTAGGGELKAHFDPQGQPIYVNVWAHGEARATLRAGEGSPEVLLPAVKVQLIELLGEPTAERHEPPPQGC